MTQLLFLAIIIGGGWMLYQRFVGDARRLAEKSRRSERERQTGASGTLIKDPETGEYRVKRDDE